MGACKLAQETRRKKIERFTFHRRPDSDGELPSPQPSSSTFKFD